MALPPPPTRAAPGDYVWLDWYNQMAKAGQGAFIRKATNPGTNDIPTDTWAIYKNTTTGVISLWINDNGTLTRLFAFALAH